MQNGQCMRHTQQRALNRPLCRAGCALLLHPCLLLPLTHPATICCIEPPPPNRLQAKQLAGVAAKHARRLPPDLDYQAVHTLSMEAREKLGRWGVRERERGAVGRGA